MTYYNKKNWRISGGAFRSGQAAQIQMFCKTSWLQKSRLWRKRCKKRCKMARQKGGIAAGVWSHRYPVAYHPVTRHRRLYVACDCAGSIVYTKTHVWITRVQQWQVPHRSEHQIDLPWRCDISYHLRINIAINKPDFCHSWCTIKAQPFWLLVIRSSAQPSCGRSY